MGLVFGGTGVNSGRPYTTVDMQAGSTQLIPSGTWKLDLGPYTTYQEYDPLTTTWRSNGEPAGRTKYIDSDGVNFRVANTTGCVIGATVTSGGAGFTTIPTVTVNSGGAQFIAVLGPYVSTITVTNGGNNYQYPPIVTVQSPAAPGVQATAYATLTGGVVTAVTVNDVGANYSAGAPVVSFSNDPRDNTGNGASAVANLAGSGQVVALLCTNFGTPTGISTSGVLPTITITGGTTTATAVPVMDWSVTSYTVTSAGSGYTNYVAVTGYAVASGTAAFTNPTIQSNLLVGGVVQAAATVSGGTIVTGGTVFNGGHYAQAPSLVTFGGGPTGTSASGALLAAVVGGQNDVVRLSPV